MPLNLSRGGILSTGLKRKEKKGKKTEKHREEKNKKSGKIKKTTKNQRNPMKYNEKREIQQY